MSVSRVVAVVAFASLFLPIGSSVGPFDPIVNGDFELYAETTGTGGFSDGALWWTSGIMAIEGVQPAYRSGTTFVDFDDDGDREAVIHANLTAGTGNHNMWQSFQLPLQLYSANFREFAYTIENGTVSAQANNQIGFSLSPNYRQHPFVGIYWEGAVLFRADDIAAAMDGSGRVRLDPAVHGEIVCGWTPCLDFKAAFDGADTAGKRSLLSQTRMVQVSFWNFNRQAEGEVVIDNVAFANALPPTGFGINP